MDINGILLKNDLLVWAERAGAQFHKSGSEWRSCCPLHGGNNNDAFAVYNDKGKQRWKCFTGDCGHGDVFDFVMKWQSLPDFMAAYNFLGGDKTPDPLTIARNAEAQAQRAIEAMQAEIDRAQRTLEELRHAQAWLSYHRNLLECTDARQLWRQRGLPDEWQDWWKLGYCPSFPVGTEAGRWLTPSLTIPVFGVHDGSDEWPVMNVRHRLLNPPKPNDKYRPERPGLQSTPYIANPYSGFDTDPILVVEGEIKAMVTFKTIWANGETIQVIGIPGKTQFRSIVDQLAGHDVYILFDPDAGKQAEEASLQVSGKYITFPMKIDDAINAGALDRAGIKRLLNMGRKSL